MNHQDALDRLGVAAMRKMQAQRHLREAQRQLDEAVQALDDYYTRRNIGMIVRSDLALHGFDPESIRHLGVSDASIRLILARR